LLRMSSNPVQLNPVLWSLVHEWRLTLLLPLVLLFRGRVWCKRQPSYAAWRFALKFQGSSSARRPAGCPRARRSRTAAM
jgi:peptidoglycan/LPS O-acetylase OafA/YrhL